MGLSVLRVSERIPPLPGGKEIHVAELTRAQVDRGHVVRVLYRGGDAASMPAPSIQVGPPQPAGRTRGLAGTALFAAAAARTAARLSRPDVVHVHGDWTESWFMTRYARRLGVPVVQTVHGALNPRYAHIPRFAFSAVDGFIALGERARADLSRCGVGGDRITVMSSGLNMGLLAAARTAAREPGLVVTVGSLDEVKNIETAIRAVLAVPDSIDVALDVIGAGPLLGRLRAVAGRSPRVRFLGQLSRPDAYRRVAAADAFVMASRRLAGKGEGVPTALLEAMALGRLCLVSTAATPRPVVTDELAYRTFDPDDRERLTVLITEALRDEAARARTGERARSAVAHLDWPGVASRVDEVYDRACAHHRGRRCGG